jgi:thioesterase domain-containing protein
VEQEFGIRLPIRAIFDIPTIEGMASALQKQGYGANWKSLIPLHSTGSKPPLFCFHWAGGHVFSYFELAAMLGDDQPVYGLQDPAIDHLQPPFLTLEKMAAFYLEEIQSIQPEGPYYLMGASMGGRTAFEAACQLKDAGKEIGLVVMLDTPLVPRRKHGVFDRARVFTERTQNLTLREKFETSLERTLVKVRKFIIFLCVKTSIPVPASVQSLSEIHRQLAFNHQPRTLDAPVMLILAREKDTPDTPDNEGPGWERYIVPPLEVPSIKTTHRGLLSQPHLSETARILRTALRKAQLKKTSSGH